MPFKLNEKQRVANDMMAGDAVHFLGYGGSRSGKTFLFVRATITRALLAPKSRHLMARFRMAHIKASIVADTWPKVIETCFPGLAVDHKKTEGYYILPNLSEVWYAGLDDKDRTEKILGQEYATILLEECSQIPWKSRELLTTRLAQKVRRTSRDLVTGEIVEGELLRLKAYYAENPPLRTHWTYKLFIEKVSPDTGKRVINPENYASLMINPRDNVENVSPQYLGELDSLGERQRKRFRDGQFGEAGEAALWTPELIAQQRLDEMPDLTEFVRFVVAIDPSGADSADDAHRDEIGIIVAGMRRDGTCVVIEDDTLLDSPKVWGELAVQRAEEYGADTIVAEQNFGGAMVKAVIEAAASRLKSFVKIVLVTASRGKAIRAEPVSVLYEQQKVWHAPTNLDQLEAELMQMTTYGYTGDRSPNRADALVWAISFLFPSVIKAVKAEGRAGLPPPRVNLGHAGLKRRRG